jgi:hypothetical protein
VEKLHCLFSGIDKLLIMWEPEQTRLSSVFLQAASLSEMHSTVQSLHVSKAGDHLVFSASMIKLPTILTVLCFHTGGDGRALQLAVSRVASLLVATTRPRALSGMAVATLQSFTTVTSCQDKASDQGLPTASRDGRALQT